jgi:hypothetical protein
MTHGILIYAHNTRAVDYALLAVISAGLAKKQLSMPATLVTDDSTISWMKQSQIFDIANTVFENIITVDRPVTDNQRRLHDGEISGTVPFINVNRDTAWSLTPYDRTLLIDSDFLIFSNVLNNYWHVDCDLLIGESINDVNGQDRMKYLDRHISDTGVKLYWATTVMFTKNQNTRLFFDTVNHVKENYRHYADVFRFDPRQFRNDIAFSVSKHILDGYTESGIGTLPPILSALDRDILYNVNDQRLLFLIDHKLDNNYCAAAISEVDIHVMNKQSIIRNQQQLLELI